VKQTFFNSTLEQTRHRIKQFCMKLPFSLQSECR